MHTLLIENISERRLRRRASCDAQWGLRLTHCKVVVVFIRKQLVKLRNVTVFPCDLERAERWKEVNRPSTRSEDCVRGKHLMDNDNYEEGHM